MFSRTHFYETVKKPNEGGPAHRSTHSNRGEELS